MKINYYAPINELGYGQVGINLFAALQENNGVALFPINKENMSYHPKFLRAIVEGTNNAYFYDCHAPSIKVWHQWDMALFPGKGLRCGFPIFELNQFTELEKHHLSSVDKLFVCSNWAKQVIEQNNIDVPTYVVPLGVDREIFSVHQQKTNKTVFINVGKWEIRKGHDVIHQCFKKAFNQNDQVELWMVNDNPFLTKEETQDWHKKYYHPKIRLLNRMQTQEQLSFLMNKADCGIFPARAEGWNLEVLELMALGIPSIVTNYAGHTEFCNQDNSYQVEVSMLETAYDGKWFKPGAITNQGSWASLTEDVQDQIIEYMRLIHKNKKDGVDDGKRQHCYNTAQEYSWKNSARKLLTYL